MAIVKKQIKDFTTLPNVAGDDYFVLQTNSGTTHKTTKDILLSDTLSISGGTLQGNLTIDGDLVVTGNTASGLDVSSNYITLNDGISGSPTLDSYIRVSRGIEDDALLLWDEVQNQWELGLDGSTSRIITENDFDVRNVETPNVSGAVETLDSFDDVNGNGCKWIVTANDGTNFRISEILSTWDSATNQVSFTETTADVGDSNDIMFAVSNDSNVIKLVVAISNNTWSFKTQRMLI